MKRLRKIPALFLAALLSVTALPNTVMAQLPVLYQDHSQQTVTNGVTLENISRFTTGGWLNINVLRVDMSNPYVKIDTLSNDSITDDLVSISALAEREGAVAAVNSSFFNPFTAGKGYADGPTIRAGDLLSTSAWYNRSKNEMASLSIDYANQLLFHYWKNDLTLITGNDTAFAVTQYNQPSRQDYQDLTVLDRKWGPVAIGASENCPDLVETVVSGNKILEIREGQPAAEIPEEGFVVVSRGEQAAKLLEQAAPGEQLQFQVTSTPDWNDLKMSTTGTSLLIQDGEIPATFSYSTASFNQRNPRTIAGSTEDGSELILVTVDGRQDNSIGLTQQESAELMLELGAYQAIMFDGGASTTMAARQPGAFSPNVVNLPSEGILRNVASGIGIFSAAPAGQLDRLIIETEDTNIFADTSRTFSLKGIDRYANPVELDPREVQWDVSGIDGSFQDNILYPASPGTGKVTATLDGLEAELEIRVLSAPVQLTLNPAKFDLPLYQNKAIRVKGLDPQGYAAVIEGRDVQWNVDGDIGSCEAGIFTPVTTGTGYIRAGVGDTHAYSAVAVTLDSMELLHPFESSGRSDEPRFQTDPQTGQGYFELSTEQFYAGESSGQLVYDFLYGNSEDQISVLFADQGLPLDPATTGLSLWLYNISPNSNRIKGEVIDSANVKHTVEFTSDLNWTGWKESTASLSGIDSPAYLTRLYIENTDPANPWGKIYFDELSALIQKRPTIDPSTIPADTLPKDEANRQADFTSGPDNFLFSLLTGGNAPGVYTAPITQAGAGDAQTLILAAGSGYQSSTYQNSTFLHLDVSQGGLRRSDPQQWTRLFTALDDIQSANLFLLMSLSPADFINAKEAQLLKDTLANYREATGKNIWVLFPGPADQSELDRGVRYISIAQSLQATVLGEEIFYEFKPDAEN
ncbi:uncharacterized protein DUF2233 [Desulfitobacterium sp. LBE]|uniref:phosphodiester glycosidase family protein n=1 Tax=Desulfitobacterium sp. LBE TaxID=884086 RepID=UPI0011993EF5|nr:phosphodiester glycosidase family protein [Desulfitobacterium sp. LBE]TWH59764.1 uncharacterized protein DUF2233 [Desulfitobacterium sp. LBE]